MTKVNIDTTAEKNLKSYQKIKYKDAERLFEQLGKTKEELQEAINEGLVANPSSRTVLTNKQTAVVEGFNEVLSSMPKDFFDGKDNQMLNVKGEKVRPIIRWTKTDKKVTKKGK